MNSYTLTPAETAVLVDHMTGGRFLQGKTSLPELQLDEHALVEVGERLVDRGLLLTVPFEEAAGVTSQLASVLSAALTPERVCIVRIVHEERTDPVVFYSFTPECITRNFVNGLGQHVFDELAGLDDVVSAIVGPGEGRPSPTAPTRKAPAKKVGKPQTRPLTELLLEARRLVMVLVVSNPDEEASSVIGLTWIDTGEGSWVVEGTADDSPTANPISENDLRHKVRDSLAPPAIPEQTRRARG